MMNAKLREAILYEMTRKGEPWDPEERVGSILALLPSEEPGLREALDAAKTVLADIYAREGKSFHGSRVKADIESVMPAITAALRKEHEDRLVGLDAETAWLRGTDTGVSSRTILAVMTGRPTFDSGGHPRDPDDFGRCYRLLKRFPAWRSRMGEVAQHSLAWKALAEHWDELTALWEEESPSRTCPRLYARMQELTK